MEMHQSPLDMFEYKTKQDDATNTCSSNIDMLEQTNEVNDFFSEENYICCFSSLSEYQILNDLLISFMKNLKKMKEKIIILMN